MVRSFRSAKVVALSGAVPFGVVVLGVCGATSSACANDFDALFSQRSGPGPDSGLTASDAGPSDADGGGTGERDGSTDAGGLACGAPLPPSSCKTPPPDCAGDLCTNTCTGCGCSCAEQDCKANGVDGTKRCISTCSGGSLCTIKCDVDNCTLNADGATAAKLTCTGAKSCTASCTDAGACDVECPKAGPGCHVDCGPASPCLLRCTNGEDCSANLACSGEATKACANGVAVCHRPCPP